MGNVIEIPSTQKDAPMEEKYLHIAAYCRVSTDQKEQDSSIELQELRYRQMIEENPDWENAGIFSERANGLNLQERSAFQTMIRQCRKEKIKLILTKSISRLGCNTLDILRVLQELRELNVDVFFEKEDLWLYERDLQIVLTAYCAFAQAESEDMSCNIRWGIKRSFQSGTSGYADFACFGYKRGDDGRLAIDEPDAQIVRRIFEMRADGSSPGALSDWLHESRVPSPTGKERWSRETISKLLKNEKYTGM